MDHQVRYRLVLHPAAHAAVEVIAIENACSRVRQGHQTLIGPAVVAEAVEVDYRQVVRNHQHQCQQEA